MISRMYIYEEDTKCFLEVRVIRSVTSSYPVSFPDVIMWPHPPRLSTRPPLGMMASGLVYVARASQKADGGKE